jgi:hypothetical protein
MTWTLPGFGRSGSDLGAVLAFLDTAVPARESERDLRRVRIAHQLPHLGTALREGRTTGEHLDVVHRITSGLDDATRRILVSHDAGITRELAELGRRRGDGQPPSRARP